VRTYPLTFVNATLKVQISNKLAQEARKQSLLASKQQNQDDDLWEVNSDLEKWSS